MIEGRLLRGPFGPGAQPGNEPKRVLREFGAPESGHFSIGSITLADPQARIRDLDEAGRIGVGGGGGAAALVGPLAQAVRPDLPLLLGGKGHESDHPQVLEALNGAGTAPPS